MPSVKRTFKEIVDSTIPHLTVEECTEEEIIKVYSIAESIQSNISQHESILQLDMHVNEYTDTEKNNIQLIEADIQNPYFQKEIFQLKEVCNPDPWKIADLFNTVVNTNNKDFTFTAWIEFEHDCFQGVLHIEIYN